jgi:hypothetical protein
LNPSLAYGLHTTLIGRNLDWIGLLGDDSEKSKSGGEKKGGNSKKNGKNHKQPDIGVICQQLMPSLS